MNFPTLDELLALSAGGLSYQWLCHKLLPFVVGSKNWNKRYLKEPLSDVATCSDETFVLLTLENNYQRWKDEAAWCLENKDKDIAEQSSKEFAPSKYTNSGKSKPNGRSRPFQGWAREGYLRFNALYQAVEKDRRMRAAFEADLMVAFRSKFDGNQGLSDSENEEDEIYPANELTSKRPVIVAHAANSRVLKESSNDSSSEESDHDDDIPEVL